MLKIWTNNLICLVTDKVDLALVAHDVRHSITKVVVQVYSCINCDKNDIDNFQSGDQGIVAVYSPSLNGFGSKVAT